MNRLNCLSDYSVGSGGTLAAKCDAKSFSGSCRYPVKFTSAPFLLALALGSGSSISPDVLQFVKTTGGESLEFYQGLSTKRSRMPVASAKDQVSMIKIQLGLSVSDLANVLQVRRPTVYQWLSGSEPRRNNLARLNSLYKVALEWRELSNEKPGTYIKASMLDGRSLMDLLCEDEININQISALLYRINERLSSEAPAKSRRSIAKRLSQKGYDQPSKDEQNENLRGYGTLVSEEGE